VHNDFEAVVVPAHEAVAASLDALRAAGASTVLLSGSGAASFGLFHDDEEARAAAEALTREMGWSFLATATRTEVPEPRAR
jgi:4-diphosphocytidyl-2C-methyl-D-erythritol kinase